MMAVSTKGDKLNFHITRVQILNGIALKVFITRTAVAAATDGGSGGGGRGSNDLSLKQSLVF